MLMMKSVRDGANQLGAWLMVSSVLPMLAINLTPVEAQNVPPVLCGNVIDGFPPNAAGDYFYTLSEVRDPGVLYRFMRKSAIESTELTAPFSPEVVQTLGLPHVSPDGRLIAFIPVLPVTSLTVWDMTTNETATLELSLEETEHLNALYDPFSRAFRRLEWTSAQTFAIKYYDDASNPVSNRMLRETQFHVMIDPLSVQRSTDAFVEYPTLPLPTEKSEPAIFLSPLGNYATQISLQFLPGYYDVRRMQIFDLDDDIVVFDAVPSADEIVRGRPRWLADESGFFYVAAPPQADARLNFAVHTGNAFVLDNAFFSAIEQAVDGETYLFPTLIPTINPNSDGIGFAILVDRETHEDKYIAAYLPHEARLSIVCNPIGYGNTDLLYPFWSPEGRYFGYWNTVGTLAFDLQTGDIYRMPDVRQEWVGWVDGSGE
ncbi:MAG: hypothetical protein IT320_18910 [Anaerolineae bacterium]|nr:hypothetical protein [Anaerolineae bacterium]